MTVKSLNPGDEFRNRLRKLEDYTLRQWSEGAFLKERQADVFATLHTFLEKGGREGYIKLPTGSGKTVLFAKLSEILGTRTLVVVPTNVLVGQTRKKFGEFTELESGIINMHSKEFGNDITITTYNSLAIGINSGRINPGDYGLLILDEAHKSLSEARTAIVRRFPQDTIKLGFTATPYYDERKNLETLLSTEIYRMSITEAIEENMLCGFRAVLAQTDTDISNVRIGSKGDYDQKELEQAINKEVRNIAAVQLYLQLFEGERGVIFCSGVDHAEDVAKKFNESGVRAAVISGRQSSEEQAKLLKMFRKHALKVLVNAQLLVEGFDDSGITFIFNLSPTLSLVRAEQRGGRALRNDPDNNGKIATIVDFLDRDLSGRRPYVTFAEVAGTAEHIPHADERAALRGGVSRPFAEKAERIEITGLKVTVDAIEVMSIVRKLNEDMIREAPEGWMTNRAVAEKLGKGEVKVKKEAENLRENHPEWFKWFLDSGKHRAEHYSPELIGELKLRFREVGAVPELAKELKEMLHS